MNRHRDSSRTLTGTRIYIRRGKYQYFSPVPLIDHRTGRATKWHILCHVADGESQARQCLDKLLGKVATAQDGAGAGDFAIWFVKWKTHVAQERTAKTPDDPARRKIWADGGKALMSALGVVERAFADFDLTQVTPVDVATFLDQWDGRRSAQSYRGHLSKFFAWCCRKGLLNANPAREVTVTTPRKRDVYMTDEQYKAIRDALLIGDDGRPTRIGVMVQCYMDLLYLLYQRGTEIRLLKWADVRDNGILFRPAKTERSSGAKVLVPVGADVQAVLARIRQVSKLRSLYVIHSEHGQPYTAHGIGSAFDKARARAGLKGLTLSDIRSKAATDAKRLGHTDEQLKIALAHTDQSTTRGYLRGRETPVSEVVMSLPDCIKR